jgi:rod shape determining protein RodA
VGAVVVFALWNFDYTQLKPYGHWIYGLGVLMLGAVLAHGHSALGAQRWIDVGPLQLQPSEFAKVAVAFGLATMLERHRGQMRAWRDLIAPIVYTAVPVLLVMKQPDLGTAIVFVLMLAAMLYMAGVPGLRLLLVFGGGFLLAVALIWAHLRFHLPLPLIHAYQLSRLLVFTNPNLDPLGAGYQIIQSQITLAAGGVHGLGLGGHFAMLTFLPEYDTDFIFSVVGLSFGLLGGLLLLCLYFVLIYRALLVVHQARDLYGTLLSTGLTAVLAVHVLMNAGMAMGIMPVVGVPLPFMSYGGSAVLASSLALGVLLSVRRASLPVSFAARAATLPPSLRAP